VFLNKFLRATEISLEKNSDLLQAERDQLKYNNLDAVFRIGTQLDSITIRTF